MTQRYSYYKVTQTSFYVLIPSKTTLFQLPKIRLLDYGNNYLKKITTLKPLPMLKKNLINSIKFNNIK